MAHKFRLVLLSLLITSSAFAISRGTMLFLTIPPSAQLNGTAGAMMYSSLTDPLTLINNPASLGRAAEYTRLAGEFNFERTRWLPGFNLSDITFSARALSLGANAGQLFERKPSRFYLGLAYSEVFLDLGETVRRGPQNEPLGTIKSWERVRGITIAGSYVRPVHISFGLSLKHAISYFGVYGGDPMHTGVEARAFANDFGVLATFPKEWLKSSNIRPFLMPTVGYALSNVGGEVRYTDEIGADPLPRTARVSLALAGGLNLPDAHGDWHLLQMEYAVQGQDELITVDNRHGDYHYQWFTGDINVAGDLLLGQSNDRIDKQRGWEIGIMDFVFVRGGSFEDLGDDWRYTTTGTGVRMSGLLRLAEHLSPDLRTDQTWSFLADHVDLSYNESRWQQDYVYGWVSPLDDTIFRQISIFLR